MERYKKKKTVDQYYLHVHLKMKLYMKITFFWKLLLIHISSQGISCRLCYCCVTVHFNPRLLTQLFHVPFEILSHIYHFLLCLSLQEGWTGCFQPNLVDSRLFLFSFLSENYLRRLHWRGNKSKRMYVPLKCFLVIHPPPFCFVVKMRHDGEKTEQRWIQLIENFVLFDLDEMYLRVKIDIFGYIVKYLFSFWQW